MSTQPKINDKLLLAGVILLLLGLVTGLGVGMMENPRMGLSSHMQGITNGLLLVGMGLLWPRLAMGDRALATLFWLSLYGTYANWLATLLAGIWGAGHKMMPLAAAGHSGLPVQEQIIAFLLMSLTAVMLIVCLMLIWGLAAGMRSRRV